MNSVIYLWRIPTLGVSEIPSFTVIVRFFLKGTYEIYCKILLGVLAVNLGQKPLESMESHILPRNTPIKLIELFLMLGFMLDPATFTFVNFEAPLSVHE